MHATAVGMTVTLRWHNGVAKVLKQFESSIKGTIRLVVQPAEEGVQGAEPMVRAGVMKGVSTVFAAHLSSELKTGSIGNFNKKWASGKKFDIELFGKAAHSGCHPEGGINTMLAAAVIIQNLYALPRNSAGFTRVNVGKMECRYGKEQYISACLYDGGNESGN